MAFLVYKSSAGSGKTFTLVKEYLKLILASNNAYQFRRVLAITFTNKASNEMKERILLALDDLSSPEGYKGKTTPYLMSALCEDLNMEEADIQRRAGLALTSILHNYSDFSISTIDKFNLQIVRKFSQDLGLPADFEIEMDYPKLIDMAVDQVLRKAGVSEHLTDVLVNFVHYRIQEDAHWQLDRIIVGFIKRISGDDFLELIGSLKKVTLNDFDKADKVLMERRSQFKKEIQNIGVKAQDIMTAAGVSESAYANGKNGLPKYFSYLAHFRSDKLMPSNTVQNNISGDKWHAAKADDFSRAAIGNIKNDLSQLYHQAFDYLQEGYESFVVSNLLLDNLHALALVSEVYHTLDELLDQHSILPINELNKRIANIVTNESAPFIYERIGNRYQHFLIDEFQDTSILQWQNLIPLVENSLSQGFTNLIVGDAKQAIYRWREGDAQQFVELPILKDYNGPDQEVRQHVMKLHYSEQNLATNYRSKANIVEFNNYIFPELRETLAGSYQKTYDNSTQGIINSSEEGHISIELVDPSAATSFIEYSLNRCLEIIKQAKLNGYDLRDIAVICRSNSECVAVSEYLIENGIEVVSPESLLLVNNPEVQLIISVLGYLTNPNDQICSSEILRYLTTHQLIDIDYHQVLMELVPNTKQLEHLLKKYGVDLPLGIYQTWSISEICEDIIRRLNLHQSPNLFLTSLQEIIHDFSAQKGGFIIPFLSYWQEKKNGFSVTSSSDTNAVQAMTIHQSKGLEFPIVLMPFGDWTLKNTKEFIAAEISDLSLPRLKNALLPLTKRLQQTKYGNLYDEEINKTLLDNINLLYVAFTRPVDQLYVMLPTPRGKNNISSYYLPILKQSEYWDEDSSKFMMGTPVSKRTTETQTSAPTSDWNDYHSNDWQRNLNMHATRSNNDPHNQNLEEGIWIHWLFSKIQYRSDFDSTWEGLSSRMPYNDQEKEMIKAKVEKVFDHDFIGSFFNELNGYEVKNERSILLADGKTYRPDRIMLGKTDTVLIDFKTGGQSAANMKQVKRYSDTLSSMGYNNIKSYLIYLDPLECIPVN